MFLLLLKQRFLLNGLLKMAVFFTPWQSMFLKRTLRETPQFRRQALQGSKYLIIMYFPPNLYYKREYQNPKFPIIGYIDPKPTRATSQYLPHSKWTWVPLKEYSFGLSHTIRGTPWHLDSPNIGLRGVYGLDFKCLQGL